MKQIYAHIPCRIIEDLRIYPEERKVTGRLGRNLWLPRREYQLWHYLVNNFNRVLGKNLLTELIWQRGEITGSNTLEVHLCSLRRKIKKLSARLEIQTIRGIGYRLHSRG